MLRLLTPLSLLLQALAAMAPNGGLEVSLGVPGSRRPGPVTADCDGGHHRASLVAAAPALRDRATVQVLR
ncbi:MAG: hypothetical protein P8M11_01685 [Planctomycetota bacterium]|nr:hypothetical protein [Planctomycetota bacterium]MDG1983255.1 hypothetical protein [Planctomycetota bacterium]